MAAVISDFLLKTRLDDLYEAISTKIERAKENPKRYAQVDVGVQARRIIENIRSVYVDALTLRESQLQTSLRQQLASIATIIDSFNPDRPDHLMAKRIQRLGDDFPGNSLQPILTSVYPKFVAKSTLTTNTIRLQLFGSFLNPSQTTPKLKFSHRETVFESRWVNEKLEFEVPKDLFENVGRSITFLEGTLTIGATFQVIIGALPASSGKVHATYFINVPSTQTQTQSCQMHLDSCAGGGHHRTDAYGDTISVGGFNNDEKEGGQFWHFAGKPSPGFAITRDLGARVHHHQGVGSCDGPHFVSITPQRLEYRARTIHHNATGTSGNMDFWINFEESRPITVSEPASSPSSVLKWGVPVYFVPPTNQDTSHPFVIHIESFDGQSYVAGSQTPPQCVRIQNEDGRIVVTGTIPKELNE